MKVPIGRHSGIVLALTFLDSLIASAVTLSIDSVDQRYPWNGVVDITYTVTSSGEGDVLDPLTNRLVFTVTDRSVTPAVVHQAVRFDDGVEPSLTAGTHHVVWRANEDGVKQRFSSADLRLAVRAYAEKYLVIDVSEGPTAERYPVTYLDAPPATADGFNCEAYKSRKIVLRQIPPGSFLMGSPEGERNRNALQEAQRRVTLTRSFYIGLFETTQAQYTNIMNVANNAGYKGPYRPMENVSYTALRGNSLGLKWPATNTVDAASFFGVLRAKAGLDFDLPTEAQWEYACRAGTTTAVYTGVPCTTEQEYFGQCNLVARYGQTKADGKGGEENNSQHTIVGCYQPNAWGLYDMLGNVEERCIDWRTGDLTPPTQCVDPVGCADRSQNVNRGGYMTSLLPRAAMRNAQDWQGEGRSWRGFRISLTH